MHYGKNVFFNIEKIFPNRFFLMLKKNLFIQLERFE